MDRKGFLDLTERLATAWNEGHAAEAAACFALTVDYADPRLYRFDSRAGLEAFFEPGPSGHTLTWHRVLYDEAVRTGVLEFTYVGQHRYHGAAIAEVDDDGLIARWREWQHRDDEHDWREYLSGPTG